MTEIVDKAARALEAEMLAPLVDAGYVRGPSDLLLSRAIVKSVLASFRDPTPMMLAAGSKSHPDGGYRASTTLGEIIVAEWRAMIDAALA